MYLVSVIIRVLVVGRALLSRRMASNGSTHMERTQTSSRSEVTSDVEVIDINQLSPSVKGYTISVKNTNLTFRPGQWVDLHIPTEETVGGYSITSPPHQLAEKGTFNLAIQHSDHPPTLWMTTKCQVGDVLKIRVGGDFFYAPPTPSSATNLLLIAGGVGINPLISMLQHHAWLLSTLRNNHRSNSLQDTGAVQLLYSAKNENELIFKETVERICSVHRQVHVQYFVTQNTKADISRNIHGRRISEADVTKALSSVRKSDLHCYVCGPPPMLESMVEILMSVHCGVEESRIHYEKWW